MCGRKVVCCWLYGPETTDSGYMVKKEVNKLNTASYKFLVFLTLWSRKNKLLEIVFCGRVGMGNMFCMYFMIKKMEGSTGIGEAKYEGFS